jgi:hypothetical protein
VRLAGRYAPQPVKSIGTVCADAEPMIVLNEETRATLLAGSAAIPQFARAIVSVRIIVRPFLPRCSMLSTVTDGRDAWDPTYDG